MSFKQIPANLGNYVVINDDASGASGWVWTYAVGSTGMPINTSTKAILDADKTPTSKGSIFKDLGVTYVQPAASGTSIQNVFRKVVKADEAVSSATPTEYFIKVVNANKSTANGSDTGKVQFARLG